MNNRTIFIDILKQTQAKHKLRMTGNPTDPDPARQDPAPPKSIQRAWSASLSSFLLFPLTPPAASPPVFAGAFQWFSEKRSSHPATVSDVSAAPPRLSSGQLRLHGSPFSGAPADPHRSVLFHPQ